MHNLERQKACVSLLKTEDILSLYACSHMYICDVTIPKRQKTLLNYNSAKNDALEFIVSKYYRTIENKKNSTLILMLMMKKK